MDFITREKAREDIVDLGLPQIVLDAFDEKPLPHNLDDQFRFPYQVLNLGAEGQAFYGTGRITPLWTGCGDYSIVAYHHDPCDRGFSRFDIESGEEEQPKGMNWQQVLIKEFKLLWESEVPDGELREVADLFGFKHIEEIIAELAGAKLDSVEKNSEWYQSFLQRLGG
jgi:hypothetical protein